MVTILHQFHGKDFYNPSWKIKHLLLGTFNPLGGQTVNYYYGRERNQTWKLLSSIFNQTFDPVKPDPFYELIKANKIACLDLIHHVEASSESVDKILGKGYNDSAIINGKTIRKYNTDRILSIIDKNPGVNIYSTWGKGPTLKEWNKEIAKIRNIVPLVSPSMVAKVPEGVSKFTHMHDDWKSKIDIF